MTLQQFFFFPKTVILASTKDSILFMETCLYIRSGGLWKALGLSPFGQEK